MDGSSLVLVRHAHALPSDQEAPVLWVYTKSATAGAGDGHTHEVRVDQAVARATRTASGTIGIPMPDGRVESFRFLRGEDHTNEIWTWVGENVLGERAIFTFGPGSVFGKVERHERAAMQLSGQSSGARLREVPDPRALDGDLRLGLSRGDVLHPPLVKAPAAAEGNRSSMGVPVTVDLVVGMTSGFVADAGSLAAAQTRLAHLVAVANSGLERGLVDHRLRLVHSLQVNYSDLTSNRTALEGLTGVSCNPGCAPASVPIGLQPLRAARDTYGGDLVVLLRRYREPQQQGCGFGWLLGGGGFPIDSTDAPFGYSVVSEGTDLDENTGLSYFCRDSTLAHETGHNMGQAHNQPDAESSGTHAYAYGYRESSSTGFYTIMALRLANSSQFAIDYFGNPAVVHAGTGRATGSPSANNGRSLQLSMPLVAQFRAELETGPQIFSSGFEGP